ncbi:MAG: VIT1/CCC1 transporter family protein, partial [Bacteroidetes bacterium]|nr:VIT1/CCC1 transporter family protein [Bacteroidota bacterium]
MNDKKLLKSLQVEVDTSYLYHLVSTLEKDEEISGFYREMSKIEAIHSGKLLEVARNAKLLTGMPEASARARILAFLARHLGYNLILGVLVDTEKSLSNAAVVKKNQKGETIAGNEDRHVNILMSISQLSGEKLGKVEGKHRNVGGNALRAAVLGANDGLVSNFSLVMGVSGATIGGKEVLIAGIAGLLAGAISMALGEWISVRSSQELYERQI